MRQIITAILSLGVAGMLHAQMLTCSDALITDLRAKDPQAIGDGLDEILDLARGIAFPRGFGEEEPQPNPLLALEILEQIELEGLQAFEKSEVYDHFANVLYSLGETNSAAQYAQKVLDEPGSNPDALINGLRIVGRNLLDSGQYCESVEYYFAYTCSMGGLSAEEFAEVGMVLQGLGAGEGDLNVPRRVAQCRQGQ